MFVCLCVHIASPVTFTQHPEICKFPSMEFYDDKLETRAPGPMSNPTWNVDPLPFWPTLPAWCQPDQAFNMQRLLPASRVVPHILVDVQGEEATLTVTTEEGNERSKSNAAEADKVVSVAVSVNAMSP